MQNSLNPSRRAASDMAWSLSSLISCSSSSSKSVIALISAFYTSLKYIMTFSSGMDIMSCSKAITSNIEAFHYVPFAAAIWSRIG
jgi:hypothetical protein